MTDTHFVNPIAEGADPTVVRHDGRYLWAQSEGNTGVAIWVSDRPTTLGRKHVVWQAPSHGPYSQEVWAPELFQFDGRWYIYFAASDGSDKHHLAYVLESAGDDPLGDYTIHGPLQTGEADGGESATIWAIDMTVLEHDGQRYAIWSGWSDPDQDQQNLYIARMQSPTRLDDERRLLLQPGEYEWQQIEDAPKSRSLVEAPQVLQHDGRTFLVYSCGASWLPTYKLGMLELTGSDPMSPAAWTAWSEPVFQSSQGTYGVGHSTFTQSPDGREWWHVFHAKQDRDPGWRRAIYAQPMRWRSDGRPDFGQPVPAGAPVPVASGTPWHGVTAARTWHFAADGQIDFDYYGHHQYFSTASDGLHLGIVPSVPVNAYRTGEKVVLRNGDYRDFRLEVEFQVVGGGHDVGALLRVSRAALGFDALRGYFVGLSVERNNLVLGSMNGRAWREIASAPVYLEPTGLQRLTVEVRGPEFAIYVGADPLAAIKATDAEYDRGSIGLRVVDTHARFTTMSVTPSA